MCLVPEEVWGEGIDQNEAELMKMVREAEWAASGNTEFPIPGAVQAEIGETIYRRFQN